MNRMERLEQIEEPESAPMSTGPSLRGVRPVRIQMPRTGICYKYEKERCGNV